MVHNSYLFIDNYVVARKLSITQLSQGTQFLTEL